MYASEGRGVNKNWTRWHKQKINKTLSTTNHLLSRSLRSSISLSSRHLLANIFSPSGWGSSDPSGWPLWAELRLGGITKISTGTQFVSCVNEDTSPSDNYLLSRAFSLITYHPDNLRIGGKKRETGRVKCSSRLEHGNVVAGDTGRSEWEENGFGKEVSHEDYSLVNKTLERSTKQKLPG